MDLDESASPVPSWEDGNYTPIETFSSMGDSSQSFEDTEEVRENFISKCLSNLSALRTEQGLLCKSFQSTSSDPFGEFLLRLLVRYSEKSKGNQ